MLTRRATNNNEVAQLPRSNRPSRRLASWRLSQAQGHTTNCHQRIRSVWWPHYNLAHRRAISYPAGKRHPSVDPAVQPNLFRHRRTALPAWTPLTEYATAGDADRTAPQHDQQGVPPARNRRCGGGHGRIGHLCARPAETAGNQNSTPHPQPRRHRSRSGSAQMCGWSAERRLHPAANP